jgi:AcrR family transcriptional regulator
MGWIHADGLKFGLERTVRYGTHPRAMTFTGSGAWKANEQMSTALDRAAARRSAILAVASGVFLRDGYSAAAMSDITAQLGGSKATLYKYFPSKRELFLAVVQDHAERALIELTPVKDANDLESTLLNMGLGFLRNILSEDSIAFYRLMISEAGRFPEIGTLFYSQHRSRLVSPLATHFQREFDVERLGFVDPLEAGELFYDLCAGSLHRRALLGVPTQLEDGAMNAQVERAVSMFLKICSAQGGDLAGMITERRQGFVVA